jgi:hypothetical protein
MPKIFPRIIVAGLFEAHDRDVVHAVADCTGQELSHGIGNARDRSPKGHVIPGARLRKNEALQQCIGTVARVFLLCFDDVLHKMFKPCGGIRVIEFQSGSGWRRRDEFRACSETAQAKERTHTIKIRAGRGGVAT